MEPLRNPLNRRVPSGPQRLESAGRPDDDRVARLAAEHWAYVSRVARAMWPQLSPAVLDDAIQETWAVVCRRIEVIPTDERGARRWLLAAIRFKVLHQLRGARTRRRAHDHYGELAPASHDQRAQIEASLTLERLLQRVPERDQAILHAECRGETASETAARLGVSEGVIYGIRRRAKRKLAEVAAASALALAWLRRAVEAPLRDLRLTAAAQSLAIVVVVGGATEVHGLAPAPDASARVDGPRVARHTLTTAADARSDLDAAESARLAWVRRHGAPAALAAPPTAAAATSKRARPPSSTSSTSSTADLRLLRRARAALDRDRPGAALRLLDRHARRFPESQLRIVREALRIDAHCREGETSAARRAYERAVAAFGEQSAHLRERRRARCW